jgi:hypothetical protein
MVRADANPIPNPIFCEGSPAMVELEVMVDRTSLQTVIEALAHICWLKAEHLEENWQDEQSARAWKRDARKLDRLVELIDG